MDPHGATIVTLPRIERAARAAGHLPQVFPRRLVFPYQRVGDAIIEELHEATGEDHTPTYSVVTTHHTPLRFEDARDISEFVNDWNHDCLTPTLTVDFSRPDNVRVTANTQLETTWGMTDDQLVAALDQALGNSQFFLKDLVERFPVLHSDAPVTPRDDMAEPPSETPAEDHAYAVDLARVQGTLSELGIDKVQHADDIAILARINDVLLCFVLDNGPSLIIRGHWDPNLRGEDFLRVFLICNEFNQRTAGCAAYCHSNVEGLQVRIEVATSTNGGLSDHQLRAVMGRAIKQVLHGIDDIAKEATGESPVLWP